MKNRLCFDVLKRLFAIVLCAVISVAYLPLLGQGDKVYAESSVWEENIQSIVFTPTSNRTIYKSTDSDEHYDENDNPYTKYWIPFNDGDTITATLKNGSGTKVLRYDGSEREWKLDGKVFDGEYNPYFSDASGNYVETKGWEVGKTYSVYVAFGGYYNDDDDFVNAISGPISVNVKESPVKSLKFTPSDERGNMHFTEADIITNGDYYEGKYEYWGGLFVGDKLTVTWDDESGTTVDYIYGENDNEWGFFDASGKDLDEIYSYEYSVYGPVYTSDEPFSLNGADSGIITYTISFMGASDTFDVAVEGSSAEEIAFAEVKSTAINELRNLANSLDWDLYRTAQQNELDKIMWRGIDAIWDATTPAQVKSALNAAKNAIKAVKTNAQLTAEEKDWNGTLSGAVPAAKGVKAKAAKKKVKVSWKKANKKNLKKFDKVEIQVCPDRNFGRANTKRVEVKKSKKSVTVKGLTKGKTYFVRVRNVKGSGQTKLVSKWSGVKKAKIK